MDSRALPNASDLGAQGLDEAALAWYAKLLTSAAGAGDNRLFPGSSTAVDRVDFSALHDAQEDAAMRSPNGGEPGETHASVNELAFRGKGPWTPEEDKELLSFVEKYGARHWRKVPKVTRLRRDAQSCRLRWTSYLSPHVSKLPFTPEEDKLLLESVSWSGETKWATIAAQKFPKRTGYQIQRRWHVLINHQRKAREESGGGAGGAPLPSTLSNMPMSEAGNSEAGDAQGTSILPTSMSIGDRPLSASGRPGHRRQGGLNLSDPGGEEGLSGFKEQSPDRPGHRRRGAIASIPGEKGRDQGEEEDMEDEEGEEGEEQPLRSLVHHRAEGNTPSRLGRSLAKAVSEETERMNEGESAFVRRAQTVNQPKNPFMKAFRDPHKSPESGATSAPMPRPMSSSGRPRPLIPNRSPEAESEFRRSQSTKRPNSLTGAEFCGSPEEETLRKAHTAKRRSPFADPLADGEMDPRRRHSTSDFKFLAPHREQLPGFMPSPAELMLLSNTHLPGSGLGGTKTPDSDTGDLRSPLSPASLRSPTSDLGTQDFSSQPGVPSASMGRTGQGQGQGQAGASEMSFSELHAFLVHRLVMGLDEQASHGQRKEHSGGGSLLEQALHQQAMQQKLAELLQAQSQSASLASSASGILDQLVQGRSLPPLPQSVEGLRRSEGGVRGDKQAGIRSPTSTNAAEQKMLENLQSSGVLSLLKQVRLGSLLPPSASVPGPDAEEERKAGLPASSSLPGGSGSTSRSGHRRSGGGRFQVELNGAYLGDLMEDTPVNPLSLLGASPSSENRKKGSSRDNCIDMGEMSPSPSLTGQEEGINLDLCLGGSALEVSRKQLGRSTLGLSTSPASPRARGKGRELTMREADDDRPGKSTQEMNTVTLLSLVTEYDAAVDKLAADAKLQFRNRLLSAASSERPKESEESESMDYERNGGKVSLVSMATVDLQSMLDDFRIKLKTLQE